MQTEGSRSLSLPKDCVVKSEAHCGHFSNMLCPPTAPNGEKCVEQDLGKDHNGEALGKDCIKDDPKCSSFSKDDCPAEAKCEWGGRCTCMIGGPFCMDDARVG